MTTYSEFYKKQKEELLATEKSDPNIQDFSQEVTMTESILDPILAPANKYVGAAVQILDLPFMLFDAIASGRNFAFKKIATAAGISEADADEIVNYGNSAFKIEKIRPGEWINKNILNDAANYEAKTKTGEILGSMAEYMPYGLIASSPKAKAVFHGTGAASGLIDKAATDVSQSEGVGTGAGVISNVY